MSVQHHDHASITCLQKAWNFLTSGSHVTLASYTLDCVAEIGRHASNFSRQSSPAQTLKDRMRTDVCARDSRGFHHANIECQSLLRSDITSRPVLQLRPELSDVDRTVLVFLSKNYILPHIAAYQKFGERHGTLLVARTCARNLSQRGRGTHTVTS